MIYNFCLAFTLSCGLLLLKEILAVDDTDGKIIPEDEDMKNYMGVSKGELEKIPSIVRTESLQRDTIIASVTTALSKLMDDCLAIDDIEMINTDSHYACGAKGHVSGLQSIYYDDLYVKQDDYNEVEELHITYSFSNLKFNFQTFGFHIFPVGDVKGNADIDFSSRNAILLSVSTSKTKKLENQFASKLCILHVKRFSVRYLNYATVKMTTPNVWKLSLASKRLRQLVEQNRFDFRDNLEKRLRVEVFKALSAAGGWVCQEDSLLSGSKLETDMHTKPLQDTFNVLCGTKSK